jgi:hypothetical protein
MLSGMESGKFRSAIEGPCDIPRVGILKCDTNARSRCRHQAQSKLSLVGAVLRRHSTFPLRKSSALQSLGPQIPSYSVNPLNLDARVHSSGVAHIDTEGELTALAPSG